MGFIINTKALSGQKRSSFRICEQGKSSSCLCLYGLHELENAVSELLSQNNVIGRNKIWKERGREDARGREKKLTYASGLVQSFGRMSVI